LVCELSGGIEKTEFPIFEDQKLYSQPKRKMGGGGPSPQSGLYKIRGIQNQRIRDAIEAMQPYNHRIDKGMPALLGLNHLCNIDKHRTLHLCRRQTISIRLAGMKPGRFAVRFPETWEDRAILATGFPEGEVQVKPEFAFEAVLDEGGVPKLAD
jgi:hypothetical protein